METKIRNILLKKKSITYSENVGNLKFKYSDLKIHDP